MNDQVWSIRFDSASPQRLMAKTNEFVVQPFKTVGPARLTAFVGFRLYVALKDGEKIAGLIGTWSWSHLFVAKGAPETWTQESMTYVNAALSAEKSRLSEYYQALRSGGLMSFNNHDDVVSKDRWILTDKDLYTLEKSPFFVASDHVKQIAVQLHPQERKVGAPSAPQKERIISKIVEILSRDGIENFSTDSDKRKKDYRAEIEDWWDDQKDTGNFELKPSTLNLWLDEGLRRVKTHGR